MNRAYDTGSGQRPLDACHVPTDRPDEEKNAPLYYPVTPDERTDELFSIIFSLISEGKIDAYQYEDGYEDFSDNSKINLKDMLDRFGIYYEEVPDRVTREPLS